MNGILIFGASGHGKVVCDIARASGVLVLGFIDRALPKGKVVCGFPVLGGNDDLVEIVQNTGCTHGVVAIGDNWLRAQVAHQVLQVLPHFEFRSLVHPQAVLGADVDMGQGNVIMAGAIVNPCTHIGNHCIINTRASVDHDCVLEDFVSIAPGATLGGSVKVGSYSAIGLGASVIHGRSIGAQTVVGAGSLVLHSLGDGFVAYGSPAKIIRKRVPGERYL